VYSIRESRPTGKRPGASSPGAAWIPGPGTFQLLQPQRAAGSARRPLYRPRGAANARGALVKPAASALRGIVPANGGARRLRRPPGSPPIKAPYKSRAWPINVRNLDWPSLVSQCGGRPGVTRHLEQLPVLEVPPAQVVLASRHRYITYCNLPPSSITSVSAAQLRRHVLESPVSPGSGSLSRYNFCLVGLSVWLPSRETSCMQSWGVAHRCPLRPRLH